MINKIALISDIQKEIYELQEWENKYKDGFFAAQKMALENLLKKINCGEFDDVCR